MKGSIFFSFVFILLIFNVVHASVSLPTTSSCPIPTAFPQGLQTYVCITLSNNQSISTPNNFDQLIVFDTLPYRAFLASNIMNVVFFDQNGKEYNAWLEGNLSNEKQSKSLATTNTLAYWINISKSIPANSNITIYLGFGSTLTNYFISGNNIGAAPQLFCLSGCPTMNYGGIDNGPQVFTFYDNFAGNQLSSNWKNSSGGGVNVPQRIKVNNGLHFNITCDRSTLKNGTGCEGMLTGPEMQSKNLIEDSLISNFRNFQGSYVGTGFSNTSVVGINSSHGIAEIYDNKLCSPICTALATIGNGLGKVQEIGTNSFPSNTTYSVQSTWWNTDGKNITGYLNYSKLNNTYHFVAPAVRFYPEIDISGHENSNPGSSLIFINLTWIKVRSPPPNGMMPKVAFGLPQSATVSSLILNITNMLNGTLRQFGILATSSPSDKIKLQYCVGSLPCGTTYTLSSGLGTASYVICAPGAICLLPGTYNIIANDTTSSKTTSKILTIPEIKVSTLSS